jgi:hypothetical protein
MAIQRIHKITVTEEQKNIDNTVDITSTVTINIDIEFIGLLVWRKLVTKNDKNSSKTVTTEYGELVAQGGYTFTNICKPEYDKLLKSWTAWKNQ